MSLGFALDMTMRGLLSTTSKLQLVSQNITNASKPGYTRKEGQDQYILTNGGSVPVKTNVVGSTDRYLTAQVVGDVSDMGKTSAINEMLDYYSQKLGATDGSSTLSSYMNDLYGSLQQISTSPETLSNKTEAVQDASNLANSLRTLSGNIQELRGQADQKIQQTVTDVNATLDKIASLNSKLVPGTSIDAQQADFEDQRMAALEDLGQAMDIQYYFTPQNQVQIFTSGGQSLLLSQVNHLSYTASTPVTAISTFQPITLNGNDITNTLTSGSLAGNIEVRDGVLADEQAKLDEFSNVLRTQINTTLNKGASLPPQISMTGTLRGLTGATLLTAPATGTLRVAIVDNSGVLQNYKDVNLTGITTVGGVITALNAIPNVNATLDANGSLVIKSTLANSGVSLNEMSSNIGGAGASMYFGMQDLFTGKGATNINITTNLQANPGYLATGTLTSGAIAAGDNVVARGDGSTALAMSQVLQTNVAFNAAGNFSAQANTLNAYVESFMSDAATKAKLADDSYETANLLYSQTKESLNNKSGVNVDEETTKMLALQTDYETSARMISTIRDLYQTLLNAVG